MEGFLLLAILVVAFIFGYFQMKKVDHSIEDIRNQLPYILILTNQAIDYDSRYAFSTYSLNENLDTYSYVIVNFQDDLKNLMCIEKLKNYPTKAKMYAKIINEEYIQLYKKSNVTTYSTNQDIKELLNRLYVK